MSKAPPSVEEIIRKHSKARVLVPSLKKYPLLDHITGTIRPSRELTDADVIESMVKKYA